MHNAGFSSDGRYFARSGLNDEIEIREFDSDKVIANLTGRFIGFQTGSSRFATLSTNGELQIWEFVESRSLAHVNQSCIAAAFSPDGRWLATSGNLGTQLYETRTWKRVADLGLDECGLVTFHPDGSGLLTFGTFTHAQRWPITKPNPDESAWRLGPPLPLTQRRSMSSLLNSFELAPQHFGRTSAMSADGRVTALVDVRSNKILINDSQRLGTFRDFVPFHDLRRVAITSDGKWIAAGSDRERHVGVFDAATAEQAFHVTQHGNMTFSPDGRFLATSSPFEMRVYRVGTWELAWTLKLPQISNWDTAPIAFQPGGRLLAVGISFHATRLVDRETGATVVNLMHSPTESSHLFGLSFGHDGSRLAVTRGHDDVCVWDLARLNAELQEFGLELPELPSSRADPTDDRDSPTLTADRGDKLLPPTHWHKFWVRLALGEILQGRWPDAIDNLNRGLDQSVRPTGKARAEVLRLRAHCYANHGDFAAARNDLQEALAIDRQHPEMKRQLARIYLLGPPELRDANLAWGLLCSHLAPRDEPVAANPPGNPKAHLAERDGYDSPDETLLLGAAQMRLGQHAQAITTLATVANRQASQPLVSLLLALANWHSGGRDAAKRHWEAARAASQRSSSIEPDVQLLHKEVSALFGEP